MIWRAITLASGMAFGATMGLWAADREYPTQFIRADVLSPTVKPGQDLRIRFVVYRRRSCAFSADRILVDSQATRYILSDLEFKSAPGPLGDDSYVTSVDVPIGMAPGEAIYRYNGAYICNPLHRLWPIVPPSIVVKFDVK